jgi:hypothetical protein
MSKIAKEDDFAHGDSNPGLWRISTKKLENPIS